MHMRVAGFAVACVMLLAACGSTEPSDSTLAGTWSITSFSDSGTVGVTTGTMTFAANGTWSALGTVTYPGEPLDSIVAAGTWAQDGLVLTLTPTGGAPGTWDLDFGGDEVVLTGRPPIFTVITLTRIP